MIRLKIGIGVLFIEREVPLQLKSDKAIIIIINILRMIIITTSIIIITMTLGYNDSGINNNHENHTIIKISTKIMK